MLKVELHAHTADDPVDRIGYSAMDLIDRASVLGYDALAITLHERQHDISLLRGYAAERGVVLISGVERTIEGCHVLLLNFPANVVAIDTFAELARLRRTHGGLVIAPHPFFPASSCLGHRLETHASLFDAVECNAMYTRWVDFNAAALRWAARAGKPVVGNGDVHVLRQLGTTWSMVDGARDADGICDAIVNGRVHLQTRPLTSIEAASTLCEMGWWLAVRGRASAPTLSPAGTY
jgi:predicted metal-dependent phosphoesterase TrpH